MKILIIGNDPNEIGGVANYTRPLATKLSELGHTVHYLFSGAYHSKYDLSIKPYIHIRKDKFPFECAEIVNSACLTFNYGHPELDISTPGMDKIIREYIRKTGPDIVHIHSRFGLPSSINEIASSFGVVVLNTIHVYGYICQKRVMIDHDGVPCAGPDDMMKCAVCTGTLNYSKERIRRLIINFKEYIRRSNPEIYKTLQNTRRSMARNSTVTSAGGKKNQTPLQNHDSQVSLLADRLQQRLNYCVQSLNNHSDLTLCVSQDVKNTLGRYGIDDRKMQVQHIGSVIAEKQVFSNRPLHVPLVIGNIGGINHYKGTTVFLDAVRELRRDDFIVKIFGRYNSEYLKSIFPGEEKIPVEFTGAYKPEDLPSILEQIDIMVLPSICNDTAPQTIFESFSGGIPIIASNIGGFPDFVVDGKNGLLFEPGNCSDLARKIDYVLDHPEEIHNYKQNVPKLKTISENAHELIELYESFLKTKKNKSF